MLDDWKRNLVESVGRRLASRMGKKKKKKKGPAAGASAAGLASFSRSPTTLNGQSTKSIAGSRGQRRGRAGGERREAARQSSGAAALLRRLSALLFVGRAANLFFLFSPARRSSGHRQLRQRPQPRRLQPWFRERVFFSWKEARPGAGAQLPRKRAEGRAFLGAIGACFFSKVKGGGVDRRFFIFSQRKKRASNSALAPPLSPLAAAAAAG